MAPEGDGRRAFSELTKLARKPAPEAVGQLQLGKLARLNNEIAFEELASVYLQAARANGRVLPYFQDGTVRAARALVVPPPPSSLAEPEAYTSRSIKGTALLTETRALLRGALVASGRSSAPATPRSTA